MSSRKMILLLVAGFIALVTVIVAKTLVSPSKTSSTAEAPPVVTTQVVAAAHDLPAGTILKDMDLKWIPWSQDAAQNGKFFVKDKATLNDLHGAVLRETIHADEPFMTGQIVQPHEQGFLAAILTPGKRAISIPLTPSSGVAGFIFPGDRVDVILTHMFSRKDVNALSERYVSETVLNDVRVLALDQRSDSLANDPKVAQLATLEVDEKQAEKLALAVDIVGISGSGNHASLSLVLRSLAIDPSKAENQKLSTTWDSDLSRAYPTINGDDGLMQKVQVMRGRDTTEASFERRSRK